ncbi:MAG: sigma-70 family RNA polymerase sigma factor [Anaerolineaceae bacterium]
MDPIDDEVELINQAKKDPEAFGVLYERYVERIYNYIYFRTGSTHDAEDLTSKVFFRALQNIGHYRHMGLPFSAWLYRIAHNLVANYHREKSKVNEISIDQLALPNLPTRLAAPETSALQNQEMDYLMMVINDMPRQKRELIILKFVEKLSNAEIAEIFNKSEGAIKSLYHRTLLELRERIDTTHGIGSE